MISITRSKRVAVVQPVMVPGGGTEAVTAWTLEALKDRYEVSLLTSSRVSLGTLNDFYGTALSDSQVSLVHLRLPPFLNRTKRFLLLKDHLMMRYCRSARRHFDLFISIGGVMDFGAPGIQYMALAPGSTLVKVLERDPNVPAWYQFYKRAFMRLARLAFGSSTDRSLLNTTLATSEWVGRLIKRLYGIPNYQVIYPPVNVSTDKLAWNAREDGFLCVARVSPEKEIERVINIVKGVRSRGFKLTLRVIGRQDDTEYLTRIQQLCKENSCWMSMQEALPRDELGSLMGRFRYGINAASGEPFGIALAEMVAAGCLVFVHNSGGQTEIVREPDLTYENTSDAIDKISKVLGDQALQRSLRAALALRERAFSTQSFCDKMRKAVLIFLSTA